MYLHGRLELGNGSVQTASGKGIQTLKMAIDLNMYISHTPCPTLPGVCAALPYGSTPTGGGSGRCPQLPAAVSLHGLCPLSSADTGLTALRHEFSAHSVPHWTQGWRCLRQEGDSSLAIGLTDKRDLTQLLGNELQGSVHI